MTTPFVGKFRPLHPPCKASFATALFKALKGGSKTRVGSFVTRSENYDAGAETAVKDHLCPHCSKEHDLDDCKDFLAKSSYARKMFVISKKLCFGCYSSDHTVVDCPQKRVCSKEDCGGSHPLGMHGTHHSRHIRLLRSLGNPRFQWLCSFDVKFSVIFMFLKC